MEEELIIKEKAETNEEYGCNPYERKIEDLLKNGVVVIDKPSGPTSHEVSTWVKKISNLKKAGHGGTLDPKVTGVLPIALENATKCIPMWHIPPKEYICLMHLHRDADEEKIKKITSPKYIFARALDIPSPLCLINKSSNNGDKLLASKLILTYTKAKKGKVKIGEEEFEAEAFESKVMAKVYFVLK